MGKTRSEVGPGAARVLAVLLMVHSPHARACTTILAGRKATGDGSVLMATSCDGGIMGRVYVVPARRYPPGTRLAMFFDFPAPATWQEHLDLLKKGYTRVGTIEVHRTYRAVLAAGHFADSVTGGMNEHGLTMGIEYMGMRPELVNRKGVVSPCSNHGTTSLIAHGLTRAKTAREAIRLMGSMAEEYGFTYYWAPDAGCAIPIADGKEAWIMEIFGPGKAWSPGCGKPGAVWCAQRVPDGEVTCNANRSRIGDVKLDRPDRFMASSNIHSLAKELGLWEPGTPFVWCEVYGTPGDRGNALREWAVFRRLAPSRDLKATGDPHVDQYPFSVRPDWDVTVGALMSVMRDAYEGTSFDVTRHPAFCPGGVTSPLARPFGSRHLFELLGIEPERCIGTETSGYVYVSQIRDDLPPPVRGCMWFTLGPSFTSCFAPIYSGVTEITGAWGRVPDFTRIDRSQVQWKFQLVEDLAGLRYQEAIRDVRAVFQPPEERLLARQPEIEAAAVRAFERAGARGAERLLTRYTNLCLGEVDAAYDKLVDYLMFKYLYSYGNAAPPQLPEVRVPGRSDVAR